MQEEASAAESYDYDSDEFEAQEKLGSVADKLETYMQDLMVKS